MRKISTKEAKAINGGYTYRCCCGRTFKTAWGYNTHMWFCPYAIIWD